MQNTVCMGDQSLCLSQFDMCKSQKCRKSPQSVSHSWRECQKKSTKQFTSSHGLVTQTGCCKRMQNTSQNVLKLNDSLTPWHSFKKRKKKRNKEKKKDGKRYLITLHWKWLMVESTPQRANRVARWRFLFFICLFCLQMENMTMSNN